jgi:hypothetical protein
MACISGRMSVWLVCLLVGLASGSLRRISPEDCEDAEFHLDPDDCPASYYRCTPDGQVGSWVGRAQTVQKLEIGCHCFKAT